MKRLGNFFLYNNAIPLFFGIIFLSAGAAFAANEDVQDAVIDREARLVSVDNSFLLNANLSSFEVLISVTEITEDTENYFVLYEMSTIDVLDGIWQPVMNSETLFVPKSSIVGTDLGLYVAKELSDVKRAEKQRLRETQTHQKNRGLTTKIIATEYKGLIGKYLDTKTESFAGYNPVIKPVVSKESPADEESPDEPADNSSSFTVGGTEVVIPDLNEEPEPDSTPEEDTSTPSSSSEETGTSTPEVVEPEPEPTPEVSTTTPATPDEDTGSTTPEVVEEPEPEPVTPPEIEPEPTPEPEPEPEPTPEPNEKTASST